MGTSPDHIQGGIQSSFVKTSLQVAGLLACAVHATVFKKGRNEHTQSSSWVRLNNLLNVGSDLLSQHSALNVSLISQLLLKQ